MGFEEATEERPPTVVAVDTADYLEVDGQEPLGCVAADWSERLLRMRYKSEVGVLCEAPAHYSQKNEFGLNAWGPEARGKVVVAVRGEVEFETMARRAEDAGAVGLVIVDNEDEWEDDFEMTLEERHRPPPAVPAVLVPKSARSRLREGLKVRVVRRIERNLASNEEKLLQFLRLRGVEVGLQLQ
ncbi:hypothetical protein AK812_SmicGene30101 [Symbiodinium microadriaticum]|uniref:PA domain-containing protein n=1 Tax=Symbiodinium microadriaticum TaxID=2951 RepID=A0A1Q9D071_SYMMI|nr:hypothetical protein AK812_SmicGene30101 [Symbiodinium microadriaticum]CAE7867606.1 unnamed protein product [Symbiodinium sp. KB8]